jgi:peptidyl-prolyl cis-trans isomerase D
VVESKPSVLRPFAEVQSGIVARLSREEAVKMTRKEGEAALALLREGKPNEVKFPALLAVSRSNPGGLAPNVIDAAMRASTKTLPAYVGVDSPNGGYLLVQVAKVVEPPLADETKVRSTRARMEESQALQQIQAMLSQVRSKADVTVAKDALNKKLEQ